MPIVVLFTFNYFFIPCLLDKGQFIFLYLMTFLLSKNYPHLMTGGILKDDNGSVNEYKKAKEEMKRLGFTSHEDYLDCLKFIS